MSKAVLTFIQERVKAGDFAGARAKAEEAIRELPRNATILLFAGYSCAELGDFAASERYYTDILSMDVAAGKVTADQLGKARKGLHVMYTRSRNYAGQISILEAQRDESATAAQFVDKLLGVATARYSLGDLGGCVGVLQAARTALDAVREARLGGAAGSAGDAAVIADVAAALAACGSAVPDALITRLAAPASVAAEDPSKLWELRCRCSCALAAAEEARVLAGGDTAPAAAAADAPPASAGGGLRASLLRYGARALAAQRDWLLCQAANLMPVPAAAGGAAGTASGGAASAGPHMLLPAVTHPAAGAPAHIVLTPADLSSSGTGDLLATVERHCQLAADVVKAASSAPLAAAAGSGSTAVGVLPEARAALVHAAGLCLRWLLPGFHLAACDGGAGAAGVDPMPSGGDDAVAGSATPGTRTPGTGFNSLSWSTLSAACRHAAQLALECLVGYAWQGLGNGDATACVQALQAVTAVGGATSPVGRVADALLTAASKPPMPVPASGALNEVSAAQGAYNSALHVEAESADAACRDMAAPLPPGAGTTAIAAAANGAAAARHGCPWLSATVAGLHSARGRVAADGFQRGQALLAGAAALEGHLGAITAPLAATPAGAIAASPGGAKAAFAASVAADLQLNSVAGWAKGGPLASLASILQPASAAADSVAAEWVAAVGKAAVAGGLAPAAADSHAVLSTQVALLEAQAAAYEARARPSAAAASTASRIDPTAVLTGISSTTSAAKTAFSAVATAAAPSTSLVIALFRTRLHMAAASVRLRQVGAFLDRRYVDGCTLLALPADHPLAAAAGEALRRADDGLSQIAAAAPWLSVGASAAGASAPLPVDGLLQALHAGLVCRANALRARLLLLTGRIEAAIDLQSATIKELHGARAHASAASAVCASSAVAATGFDRFLSSAHAHSALLPLPHLSPAVLAACRSGPAALAWSCHVDETAQAAAYALLGACYLYSPVPGQRVDAKVTRATLLQAAGRDPCGGDAFALLGLWYAASADAPVAVEVAAIPLATVQLPDPDDATWLPSLQELVTPAAGGSGSTPVARAPVTGKSGDLARQCLRNAHRLNHDSVHAVANLADASVAAANAAAASGAASGSDAAAVAAKSRAAAVSLLQSYVEHVDPHASWAWLRLGALAYQTGCNALKDAARHRAKADSITAAATSAEAASAASGPAALVAATFNKDVAPAAPTWSAVRAPSDPGSGSAAYTQPLVDEQMKQAAALDDAATRDLAFAVTCCQKALAALPGALSTSTMFGGSATAMVSGASSPLPVGGEGASGDAEFASTIRLACRCWHVLASVYKVEGRQAAALKASQTAASLLVLLKRASGGASLVTTQASNGVPVASVLSLLGECYSGLSMNEEAVAAFRLTTVLRPTDAAAWYAIATACRSLARRCIGDGIVGAGVVHLRNGIAAAHRVLRIVAAPWYAATASADSSADEDPYAPLAAGVAHAAAPAAPAPASPPPVSSAAWIAYPPGPQAPSTLWKLLGDLHTIGYDVMPNAFGAAAAGYTLKAPVGEVAYGRLPAPSAASTAAAAEPAERWLRKRLVHATLGDAVTTTLGSTASGVSARLALLTHQPDVHEMLCYADAATAAYAKAADAARFETVSGGAGDAATAAAGRAATLCGALCDLGRGLYLQALAIINAVGSTGAAVLRAGRAAGAGSAGASGDIPDKRAAASAAARSALVSSLPGAPDARRVLLHAAHLRRLAAAAYRQAVFAQPTSARAWNGLGVTAPHPLLAQHALVRSIGLGGGGISLVNLAALYIQYGRLELASDVLMQAQGKDPNNSAMWTLIAMQSDAAEAAGLAQPNSGEARASYLLASDLSSHPAAMLPAVLHMLREDAVARQQAASLLISAAGAAYSTGGSAGGAFGDSGMWQSLSTMVAERDPGNPLGHVAKARAHAQQAIQAVHALLMVHGGGCIDPVGACDEQLLWRIVAPFAGSVSAAAAAGGAAEGVAPIVHMLASGRSHALVADAGRRACAVAMQHCAAAVTSLTTLLSGLQRAVGAPDILAVAGLGKAAAASASTYLAALLYSEAALLRAFCGVVGITLAPADGAWRKACSATAAAPEPVYGLEDAVADCCSLLVPSPAGAAVPVARVSEMVATGALPQWLSRGTVLRAVATLAAALAARRDWETTATLLQGTRAAMQRLDAVTADRLCEPLARVAKACPPVTRLLGGGAELFLRTASQRRPDDARVWATALEMAAVDADTSLLTKLAPNFLAVMERAPRSFAGEAIFAWCCGGAAAVDGADEAALAEAVAKFPRGVLPQVAHARVLLHLAVTGGGAVSASSCVRMAQAAIAAAKENLTAWLKRRQALSRIIEQAGQRVAMDASGTCSEDDLVLASPVGVSMVENLVMALSAAIDSLGAAGSAGAAASGSAAARRSAAMAAIAFPGAAAAASTA